MVAPLFASLSGSVTSLQQSTPLSGSGSGNNKEKDENDADDDDDDDADTVVAADANGGRTSSLQDTKVYCAASKLSRLLFVLGQGALCTLVYTEKLADAAKKVSDRKDKGSDKGSVEEGGKAVAVGGKGRKKDKGAVEEAAAGGSSSGEGVDAMEEEMGNTHTH